MEQIKKGSVLKAAILSFVFACATALCVAMPNQAWADEPVAVAEVNGTPYTSFDDALAAAKGMEDAQVTIKLLANVEGGFNVGNSKGTAPQNITLDLNTYTIYAQPGVGSNNNSNGIRVLYKSSLTIKNGTVTAADGKGIARIIANYGTLTLNNVVVAPAAETDYTINNRGDLTLEGKTEVNNGSVAAITNDPYDTWAENHTDATLKIEDSQVNVGIIQIERYERKAGTANVDGEVVLKISAGTATTIVEDGESTVNVDVAVSGGTFTEGIDPQYIAEGSAALVDEDGNYTVLPEDDAFDKAAASITIGEGKAVYYEDAQTANNISDAKPCYKVTFEGEAVDINPQFVEASGTVAEPADQTWEGHTFVGWMFNGEAWDFDNDKVQGPMTLTAEWAENSAGTPGVSEPEKESEKSSTPKTGDAAPFAAVAGIAALAIAGVAIARRQMI